MVDYSKWNNFHDSSDDESEGDERSGQPIVHHYDQAQSITIGPNGTTFQDSNNRSISAALAPAAVPSTDIGTIKSTDLERKRTQPMNNEQQLNETPTHSWKQTRHEVEIWIPIPFMTKVSEIVIELIDKKLLRVRLNSSSEYFSQEFKYKVEVDEEDQRQGQGQDGVSISVISDWEIITKNGTKQIKLSFVKHQYLSGSTIWWSACFVGDPVIDVLSIPERRVSSEEKIKKQSFSAVWREANETFLQKIETEKGERRAMADLSEEGGGGQEEEEEEAREGECK
jgi:hypothetical protein